MSDNAAFPRSVLLSDQLDAPLKVAYAALFDYRYGSTSLRRVSLTRDMAVKLISKALGTTRNDPETVLVSLQSFGLVQVDRDEVSMPPLPPAWVNGNERPVQELVLTAPRVEVRPIRTKHEVTATTVELWWRAAITAKYGSFVQSFWSVKEKTMAKSLVETYGPDLLRSVVTYFFEVKWPAMVSTGRWSGVPPFPMFFSMREKVFGDFQAKKDPPVVREQKARTDEHRPVDARPIDDVGWGK